MDNKESKYDESGINKETYKLLFSDYDNIPEDEKPPLENSYIITIIQSYTKFREKNIFSKVLKNFLRKNIKLIFQKSDLIMKHKVMNMSLKVKFIHLINYQIK